MKSNTNIYWNSLILNYYKTDFENIKVYFQKLIGAVKNENFKVISALEELQKKGIPNNEIAEILDEDEYNVKVFEINTYQLALVFLYTVCEKTLKTDLFVLEGNNKKSKKLYKWDIILELYSDKGIQLRQNSFFKDLNELRLLNNCIKHNGRVNAELSNSNRQKWKENEKIIISENDLLNYSNVAESFFDELTPIIDTYNKSQLFKEDIEFLVD
ncbi:MAG: hypothetical protein HUJ68_12275, partial [Clostridia bacterium]|nr:hypothetical protein [Clostridia bacterium]